MAYKHVIRAKTKNLFDISKVTNYPPTYNVDNSYLKTKPLSISSIIFLKETLIQLCPNLISGNTYVFNAKTTGKYQQILLNDIVWEFGTARTLTDADLNKTIGLYAEPTNTADEWTIISEIQITEGSTPTPYTPYNYLQSNKRMIKVSNVCQLLDKSKFWGTTRNGVTVTNNRDGTFTINGTATYDSWFLQPLFQFQTSNPGYHTYLLDIGQYSGNANAHGVIYFYDDDVNSSIALIGTEDSSAVIHKINGPIAGRGTIIQARFAIVVLKGTTVTNWTIRPQFFDLTEMYGAGNEPTTVAQFRQDFPNEMYEYSPVCWKKFRRLKYIANKEPVQLYAKNIYNYLTLNRGKYIANKEPVQLLDKSNYEVTSTNLGITWTNNGDGTITANGNVVSGTSYSPYRISLPQFREVKNNHKYALFSGINNINVAYVECLFWLGKSDGYYVQHCVETNFAGTFGFTIPQGEYLLYQRVELRVRDNYTANNLVFKPQLFDLTAMYGAGHEPATVEQFRADYPNELYDYNPYNAITFR